MTTHPGPTLPDPPDRPTRWSEDSIVAALRAFEARVGRPCRANDLKHPKRQGLPSHEAIRRVFYSFPNATIAAYGEGFPQGGADRAKDEDTEAVILALYSGATLKDLADERGMSGQALGRRVRRFQEAHGLPVTIRKPGRPKGHRGRTRS